MTETPSAKPNPLLFIAAAIVAIVIAATAMVLVLTIHRAANPGQVVSKFYAATSCDQIRARVTDRLWTSDYAACNDAAVKASAASLAVSIISTSTSGNTSTIRAEVTDNGTADNGPPSSAVVTITLIKVGGAWKINSDERVPAAH